MNLSIPDYVINEINKFPISKAERMVYKYNMRDPDEIPENLSGKLYELFVVYLRQTDKNGLIHQIFGFLSYLKFRTKGKNYLRILWYYLTRNY